MSTFTEHEVQEFLLASSLALTRQHNACPPRAQAIGKTQLFPNTTPKQCENVTRDR